MWFLFWVLLALLIGVPVYYIRHDHKLKVQHKTFKPWYRKPWFWVAMVVIVIAEFHTIDTIGAEYMEQEEQQSAKRHYAKLEKEGKKHRTYGHVSKKALEPDKDSSHSSDNDEASAAKKYQEAISNLNKGTVEDVKFNSKTNTLTYIGYDDMLNWNHSDFKKTLPILESWALRQASKYDIYTGNLKIILTSEDGTKIAHWTNNGDWQFDR